MEALVIKVIDDYTVVINRGSQDGITWNDRFVIYQEDEEMIDPITGDSLGKLQLTKGTAKVQSIQEKMSVIVSDKYRTISRTMKPPFAFNMNPVETYEESQAMPFERQVKLKDLAKVINRK
jgi:hypothetical protein